MRRVEVSFAATTTPSLAERKTKPLTATRLARTRIAA